MTLYLSIKWSFIEIISKSLKDQIRIVPNSYCDYFYLVGVQTEYFSLKCLDVDNYLMCSYF